MSEHLDYFGLERSPFADEATASVVIGTRALRKVVARIQAALRDGEPRLGVLGVPGIGKSCLAHALPKLFAGRTRVATIPDPRQAWPDLRLELARTWQLPGEKLSRAGLLEAAQGDRLVLVIDQAETAPTSLLEHLDVLQKIGGANGKPVVNAILFVGTPPAEDAVASEPLRWLESSQATLIRFEALEPSAVPDYLERRLARAGYRGAPLFTPRAALEIHAETDGVPGEIGRVCERLLREAARRRLRTIDEPFVRALDAAPGSLAKASRLDDDTAWDDADHHPRETPSGELLLDREIAPAAPLGLVRPTTPPRAERPPAALEDPDLEAYLSAPASPAELRAIRGGALRRNARPFAVIAAAALTGGVLLAWALGDGQPRSAAPPTPANESPRLEAGIPSGLGADDANSPPASPGLVLGRPRGPAQALPAAGPGSTATRASEGPTRPPTERRSTPSATLARGALQLPGASAGPAAEERAPDELDDLPGISPEHDLPDLRPTDLAPPASLSGD